MKKNLTSLGRVVQKELLRFSQNFFKFAFLRETFVAFLFLLAMVLLPSYSILARTFGGKGLAGAGFYMSHLLVFIALAAGLCVSRSGRNIAISFLRKEEGLFTSIVKFLETSWRFLLLLLLFFATVAFFAALNVGNNEVWAELPQWVWQLPLPLGMGLLLLQQIHRLLAQKYYITLIVICCISVVLAQAPLLRLFDLLLENGLSDPLYAFGEQLTSFLQPFWIPLLLFTIAMMLVGLPVYLALAGIALFSFSHSDGYPEIVINDFYALLSENVILQSLPLFAFTGFILSEGRSAQRLVDFLNLIIGRVRGGVAVMAILLSAFFTTLTGASGVTILALGGLFVVILERSGYSRAFSVGLLTACGSIGLLLPPSLPIIMYSVLAGISIKNMFLAGILPGIFLLLVMIMMAIYASFKIDPAKQRQILPVFSWKALVPKFLLASGEIALPLLLLSSIFLLKVTLVEISALSSLYALILVCLHRDYTWKKFANMLKNYLEVLGGILLVIGFARGLADYLALHDIPLLISQFAETFIHNKILFLLLLNVLLLITGALMDIYSAIVIVAPLVVAVASRYAIAPEQLGIIFLANLELGYMTPPIGMSLFLARYRFEEPILRIYRYVLPFLLVMLIAVLIISYVPWFSAVFIS